ncbi:MAG: hypothetical protein NTZ33_14610 [Bacteroidetes bacterium]|nr:hypothetical protein [Bacteroidota bacterium]
MRRYILIFLLLINFSYLYSAEEKSINVKTARSLYNSSFGNTSYPLNVKDNKYSTLLTQWFNWGFDDRNGEGIIRLKIDHDNPNIFNAYKATVNFEVTYDKDNNTNTNNHINRAIIPVSSLVFSMEVVYDPLVTLTQQLDMQEFHIPDAVNINVRIISITFEGNNYTAATTPENLIVEAETRVERNYNFISGQGMFLNLKNKAYYLDFDSNEDELEIFWNYIPGAEEYELEWTFINEYEYQSNLINLNYSFKNNATKVRIKDNFYRLPLVFDKGYLVYRVRPVGLNLDWENEDIADWSLIDFTDNINNLITNSSLLGNVSYYHCAGHELKFNWQYIATYAEEGKNKAVVNYMDNTLRSRQQVTKSNTNKEAIAGETIYDFQGRPAISILPVPTGSEPIKFYHKFNLNPSNTHYFWENFDKDASNPCYLAIDSMKTTDGASRYYSPLNPDKTLQQVAVPDAQKFPFVQTEYEPDNTGKIRRQGGAGKEFQLAQNGHYTSYIYGQPSQTELDRLFGSEVGFSEHYQKNAVIDPNGQVSVSYIDMYGKVIATALAGVSPDSLIALESNSDPAPIDENLLASSNHITADSIGVDFSTDFIVTKNNTPYHYTYNLDRNYFNECLGSLCYTCVYDLSITLVNNNCPLNIINNNRKVGTIDSLCSNSSGNYSYDTTVNLNIGSYTLTKKLSLSQTAIDTYATWYIDSMQTRCFNPATDKQPDSNGCCWTCEKCKQSINNYEDYLKTMRGFFPNWSDDSIQSYYNTQQKLCKKMCELPSDCEITYEAMLSDVSPGGQYAQYKEESSGKIKPELFPVSILNEANVLQGINAHTPVNANWRHPYSIYLDQYRDTAYICVDIDDGSIALPNLPLNYIVERKGGRYIRPEYLKDVATFVKYWQSSFAESLLPYHPEYYYYLWCSKNDDPIGNFRNEPISSNQFDRLIGDAVDNITTFNLFDGEGFFENILSIINKDPFFSQYGEGTTGNICDKTYYFMDHKIDITPVDLMGKLLNTYKRLPNSTGEDAISINIAQLAWMTHNCEPAYYNSGYNSSGFCFPEYFRPFVSSNDYGLINPKTFKTYFSYYLMCKKKVQEVMADCFSNDNNSFINQELPPFTMKARGMYSPLYFEDDPSIIGYYFSLIGMDCDFFGIDDYEWSEYYNTFKNDLIFPSECNVNDFLNNNCNYDYHGMNPTYHNCHSHGYGLKDFLCTEDDSHHKGSRIESYIKSYPFMAVNTFNPFYYKKERRFPKLNDSYGMLEDKYGAKGDNDDEVMADMQRKADEYWYHTTGQCPLARDLQMFLSNIATFYNQTTDNTKPSDYLGLLSSSPLNVAARHFSKAFYDALLGDNTEMKQCTWNGSANGSSLSGVISIDGGKLTVDLSGFTTSCNATWERIINISQLTVLSSTTFTVLAKYLDNNDIPKDIVLNGSITNIHPVDIDLYACANLFSTECNTSDEAKALRNVLSTMLLGSQHPTTPHFTSTYPSTPNTTDQGLSDMIINSKLKRYFYDPSSTTQSLKYAVEIITNSTSPVTYDYKFKIKTNNSNPAEIIITFTTEALLPDGYFYAIKHLSGTNNQFEIKFKQQIANPIIPTPSTPPLYTFTYTDFGTYTATVDYTVSYNSIPTQSLEFDAGKCEHPISFSCRTPYHKNFRELESLLQRIVKQGKLSHDFYLFPGSYVSEELLMQWGYVFDLHWKAVNINDTLFVNILGRQDADTICSLWFKPEALPISSNNPPFSPFTSITSVTGFKLHPAHSSQNFSTYFQFTASDGNVSFPMNGGSCLLISDCIEPCKPGTMQYNAIATVDFENNNAFSTNFTPITPNVYQNNFNENVSSPILLPDGNYALVRNFSYSSSTPYYSNPIQEIINPGNGRFLASRIDGSNKTLTIEKTNIPFKIGKNYKVCFDYLDGEYIADILFEMIDSNKTNTIQIQGQLSSSASNNWNWSNSCSSPFTVPVGGLDIVRIYIVINSSSGGYTNFFLDNLQIMEEDSCNNPMNPFPSPPPFSAKDSCMKTLNNIAANNTYQQNKQMLDSMQQDFVLKYKRKCLNTIETLRQITISPEYHYTLYYYDQAGLLLKTIPPEGVKTYNDANTLTLINNERLNGLTQSYFPLHRMPTIYTYNSLNQLIKQKTPDAGTTFFWYDKLGRIILSQNAKQQTQSNLYSYTLYDAIGRIVEVGEANLGNISTTEMMYDYTWFKTQIQNSTRTQITVTLYDNAYYTNTNWTTLVTKFSQDNLRNRVAMVAVYENNTQLMGNNYIHATHYSYDIHGNVNALVQDNKYVQNIDVTQRFKLINYEYDLISGKVNKVIYQPNKVDQFMHRYEYDADNRLTHVFTSKDGKIWEKEAKYWYYKHGPLARTEIGDLEVEGMDYAYTLQGWVKGINSNSLDASKDLGRDADNGIHAKFASDAAAYSLQYFREDYKPIDQNFANFTASIANINQSLIADASGLYNGNISHMVTTIKDGNANIKPQLTAYRYDQLNRIKQMRVYQSITANSWNASTSNAYAENYTYDANGNIKTLDRYDNATSPERIDNLQYAYNKDAQDNLINNRLRHINDDPLKSGYCNYDIDNQNDDNYTYDVIGNLVGDAAENISNIEWNVYGKIKYITKTVGDNIEFVYDAMGNRICKKIIPKTGNAIYHFYTRDAQGNILATYKSIYEALPATYHTFLNEIDLYGSSRIGIKALDKLMQEPPTTTDSIFSRILGYKRYEIANHLGNVISIFSDRKIVQGTSTITAYQPVLIASMDYYPFGMAMNDRGFNSSEYRFGFNGQEKDQEIYNNQSTTTATFWEYDGRIGRRWNVDPMTWKYSWESPYAVFHNNPILIIDQNGLEGDTKDNPVGPTRLQRKFERKFNSWKSKHLEELKDLSDKEILDRFQNEYGEKRWFKKYLNNTVKSHATNIDVHLTGMGGKLIAVGSEYMKGSDNKTVDLNTSEGRLLITYQMEFIRDQIQIINTETGESIYNSGLHRGSVGSGKMIYFNLNGNSKITILVNGGITKDESTVFYYKIILYPKSGTDQKIDNYKILPKK